MKKIIISYLAAASLVLSLSGCSLLGLDLQEKYDYDYSPAGSNQLDMTVWEFLQEKSGTYSRFLEAVEYAEINPEIFDQPGITVFVLQDAAIESEPADGSGTNLHPGGYWAHNRINGFIPDSWEYFPIEEVRQFVLQHIVRYPVSFNEFLEMVPNGKRTLFPTMAENGYGYVSFHMLNFTEAPEGGEQITRLYINDFSSHYTKLNPSGWGQYIYPALSNQRANNGSYVHVMGQYLDFPTDEDLASTNIYLK